ncbi:uncharacterized protein LOC127284848 [Leptopilina boulardi]|uniref:uncharacterized protein LOC127284848 n=1 Tax=Leptopilina boulardi TaxID=63433 RepID=UPI0021F578A1|nr:uncharacterized protein LOC127284848 [Leptopilina boulardi]
MISNNENESTSSLSSQFQGENDVMTESSIVVPSTSTSNSSLLTFNQNVIDYDVPEQQISPFRRFSTCQPYSSTPESSVLTFNNEDNDIDNISDNNHTDDNGSINNDNSDINDDNDNSNNGSDHNDNDIDNSSENNHTGDNSSSDNDRRNNDNSDISDDWDNNNNDIDDNVSSDNDRFANNENDWLNNPIYDNANICGGDALNQILKIYVSNRLTKTALGDMLSLINNLLPEDHSLPKTKYKLTKLIDKVLPPVQANFTTKHRICADCLNYVGEWSDSVNVQVCLRCNSRKLDSFFLEFDIETELRIAFEVRDLHCLIDSFKTDCLGRNPELVTDLISASEYRRLKTIAIPGEYDLFMIWFTDGVQMSKSGRSQMWPVYAQIVNIPPRFRRSFQFVCGIFYRNEGIKKPDMNSYLQPFSLSLNNLFVNGFEWLNQKLQRKIRSKVLAPIAILDAPARASVQNINYYNGEYSCASCEAKGESCPTGAGWNWIYPIVPEEPPLRSSERMEIQTAIVEKYENLKHFRGVKGRSVVTNIPYFNRSKGFPHDYMHSVLLGEMLALLTCWCNSNNHAEDFYLTKENRDEISEILVKISPPDDVTRNLRSLLKLKDWKASEFRAFLVYFGPIVLKNRFKKSEYFDHFLLLVKAIQLLSKEKILPAEIDLADSLLHIFIIDVERLYGLNKCTYNLHQLKHLAQNVREYGPLWVWSAFLSEDQNGELVKMTHGSNKIDVELSNTIKIIQAQRCINYLVQPERPLNVYECCTHGPSIAHTITDSELLAISHATGLANEQLLEAPTPIFSRRYVNIE